MAAAGTALELGDLGATFDSLLDRYFAATRVTNAAVVVIPEPGTALLLGLGLFGLARGSRRR